MTNESIDLDKVISALSNKTVKDNSDSIMGMAQEVNRVLSEFEKICKTLENMHVLPALIRGIGKKYDIDVEKPLGGAGIKPTSDYHKLVFERLNVMSEHDIGLILSGNSNGNQTPANTGNQNK